MQDSQGGGKHEKQETVTQQCRKLCSCQVQRAGNNKKGAATKNRGFSKRELWTPCCTLKGLSWEKKNNGDGADNTKTLHWKTKNIKCILQGLWDQELGKGQVALSS